MRRARAACACSWSPRAASIAPFGWHLLYLDAEELPALAARLRRLPVPMVFDHMAHVIEGHGTDGPGFAVLLELLREGIAWVKLSNALFARAAERARLLARTNPDRMLWASTGRTSRTATPACPTTRRWSTRSPTGSPIRHCANVRSWPIPIASASGAERTMRKTIPLKRTHKALAARATTGENAGIWRPLLR
jgi:hypothetical protein